MVSFDDDGTVIFDPDKVYRRQLTAVPAEYYETQAMDDYRRFIELLDGLVARFEKYYDLGGRSAPVRRCSLDAAGGSARRRGGLDR